ncbi:SDR family NAD(P)-dependent oxidoreductase [Pseudonocardia sp.]|uniref:SDR family NAD(P)-dependent oxidoreductase n=1 Tax=Pseudonocardia sp. TaxID=60912 RepID=UPI0031FC01A7
MMSLAGRSVLVTGAGGFIGGHIVERVVGEGARVRALCRYNSRNERGTLDWLPPEVTAEVEVVLGELRDVESVSDAVAGTDVVLHLGAQIAIPYSYVNPRDFIEVNVLGALNVAQAALRHGVTRVVHTSTSEVYGSARAVPMTEAHPLEPQSPYAASKLAADKLMDSYHRSFDLPVCVLRPFNTYGPRQSARAIIPTIISQALAGSTVRLGSLSPRRDLTYVDDTAAAFVAAATADAAVGRTIQLGANHDVSVAELVELVADILGRELSVETESRRVRPESSEVERLISGAFLARELLGWEARVPLRAGIERTIAWMERNADRFRPADYVI